MKTEEMRAYIIDAYPGDKWKARCRCMGSRQVYAIYCSLQSRNRTGQKKAAQVPKKNEGGIQLSIFDVMEV